MKENYYCLGRKFCKKGWKAIGNRCYQLGCTIASPWRVAEKECKKIGADLARIGIKIELDAMLIWLQLLKMTGSIPEQGDSMTSFNKRVTIFCFFLLKGISPLEYRQEALL